ncbi:Fungal specific transcription factor domain-containing protein [Cladophialophora immunda]|nr:Fungal specific transcription factor domain-containing protein [Cladophialophora immunda]
MSSTNGATRDTKSTPKVVHDLNCAIEHDLPFPSPHSAPDVSYTCFRDGSVSAVLGGQTQWSTRELTPESEKEGYLGDSSTFKFMSKVKHGASTTGDDEIQDISQPQKRPRREINRATDRVHDHNINPTMDMEDWFLLPPRSIANALVDGYFKYVHQLYPFIHEPSFRKDYESVWNADSSHGEQALSFGLINLVFALGSEFADGTTMDRSPNRASGFMSRAKAIIYANLFRTGSLEIVQALLLLCLYLQGTSELNKCWNLVGLMIRMAYGIGLHMDPARFGVGHIEKEMRKRIWWGCFNLDRTLSFRFGRPPAIRTDDGLEVTLPLLVDDAYIQDEAKAPTQPDGQPSYIEFFVRATKLTMIMEDTLRHLYLKPRKLHRQRSEAAIAEEISSLLANTVKLDGELTVWEKSHPPHLAFHRTASEDITLQRLQNNLRVRALVLRSILHRQAFLLFCRDEPIDEFQRAIAVNCSRACIAAARQTIRLINTFHSRRLISSLFQNLHYVFSSMGVLQCLQTLDKTKLDSLGESGEDEVLEMGMRFLDDGCQQSSLAATYMASLRQVGTKGRARSDHHGCSPSQLAGASASISAAERDVRQGSDLIMDASSFMIAPTVSTLELTGSFTNPVRGPLYPGGFGTGFPPDFMLDEDFNTDQFFLGTMA